MYASGFPVVTAVELRFQNCFFGWLGHLEDAFKVRASAGDIRSSQPTSRQSDKPLSRPSPFHRLGQERKLPPPTARAESATVASLTSASRG